MLPVSCTQFPPANSGLEKCGKIGSLLAGKVIEEPGAKISPNYPGILSGKISDRAQEESVNGSIHLIDHHVMINEIIVVHIHIRY